MSQGSDTTRYAIFGGQGGGEVIADYFAAGSRSQSVVGFLNDEAETGSILRGYPVLGDFADWPSLPSGVQFLAPLHKAKHIQKRRAVVEGLGIPASRWGCAMHPDAVISPAATLGHDVCIGPLCDISPSVTIGNHVALRAGASLGHDVVLDDFSFFGPRAVALGYVHIGEGAHIGPGTVIREGVRIGRYAVVGFATAVVEDIEDFAIVVGNPARRIGTIEPLAAG